MSDEEREHVLRATQEQIERSRRSTLPAPPEEDVPQTYNFHHCPECGFENRDRLCELCGIIIAVGEEHPVRDCIAQRLENIGNHGGNCPWCYGFSAARDEKGRCVFNHARTCPRKADK